MKRTQAIQILRAGAAIGVMIFHILYVSASRLGTKASFGLGAHGVDIFFVISGFVIAASGLRLRSPGSFLRHRFARVIPLYWLLTFAVFAVAAVAPNTLQSTVANPLDLLKSLFFIPYRKSGGVIQPMLYQGWTLNYEMFFYLVFGFSLMFERAVFVLFAFFLSIVALGIVFAPHWVIFSFYTSSIILEFIYGLTLYLVTDGARRTLRGQWLLLPLGLIMLCAGFYYLPTWPDSIKVGVPAATIVAGAIAIPNKDWVFMRWLEALGDASYSIYLVHAFMVTAAYIFAVRLFGVSHPDLVLLCMIGAAVPSTILLSLALYRFFEKPTNLWLSGKVQLNQVWSSNLVDLKGTRTD